MRDSAFITHKFIDGVLYINWDAFPDAVEYDVYRSDEKDGKYSEIIVSVKVTKCVDLTVKRGKKYYYQVVTKDMHGRTSDLGPTYEVEVK